MFTSTLTDTANYEPFPCATCVRAFGVNALHASCFWNIELSNLVQLNVAIGLYKPIKIIPRGFCARVCFSGILMVPLNDVDKHDSARMKLNA